MLRKTTMLVKSRSHRKQIAVVGDSRPDRKTIRSAEEVGRTIALSGAILVCGGLGGVMKAAARGARQAGGFTLGILPGNSREEANRYVDCAVTTGLGELRNFLIVRTADAVIGLAGRFGTLSEIAMALTLEKPVIGLGTWDIEGVRRANDAGEAVRMALEQLD